MVRVFSFDFTKAFDTVPHDILCNKLKTLPINPYIINWIDFLTNRHQQVVVDGIKTEYLPINRGVPQGTVLGPILFSIMINDLKPFLSSNILVKFDDYMNLGVKVTDVADSSETEVKNVIEWVDTNRMELNFKKSWEMVIHGKISCPLPDPLPMISHKNWLKILGVTFQANPIIWDMNFDELMSKACSRIHIIRTC
jgi:sarcosine oxidase/L-pipecolate oxidase